jgi:hypothetical protein
MTEAALAELAQSQGLWLDPEEARLAHALLTASLEALEQLGGKVEPATEPAVTFRP